MAWGGGVTSVPKQCGREKLLSSVGQLCYLGRTMIISELISMPAIASCMFWTRTDDLQNTGLGRSYGGVNGNPLQYSCLKNPMDRGAWQATVHGITESDTTE